MAYKWELVPTGRYSLKRGGIKVDVSGRVLGNEGLTCKSTMPESGWLLIWKLLYFTLIGPCWGNFSIHVSGTPSPESCTCMLSLCCGRHSIVHCVNVLNF